MDTKYKIIVKTLQGRILTFSVDAYDEAPGGFIEFTDRVTRLRKAFHASNCEIIIAGEGPNGR